MSVKIEWIYFTFAQFHSASIYRFLFYVIILANIHINSAFLTFPPSFMHNEWMHKRKKSKNPPDDDRKFGGEKI